MAVKRGGRAMRNRPRNTNARNEEVVDESLPVKDPSISAIDDALESDVVTESMDKLTVADDDPSNSDSDIDTDAHTDTGIEEVPKADLLQSSKDQVQKSNKDPALKSNTETSKSTKETPKAENKERGAPRELTRREREALEKKRAHEHYLKMKAKEDAARLAIIKKKREEQAAMHAAEQQAKEDAKLSRRQ